MAFSAPPPMPSQCPPVLPVSSGAPRCSQCPLVSPSDPHCPPSSLPVPFSAPQCSQCPAVAPSSLPALPVPSQCPSVTPSALPVVPVPPTALPVPPYPLPVPPSASQCSQYRVVHMQEVPPPRSHPTLLRAAPHPDLHPTAPLREGIRGQSQRQQRPAPHLGVKKGLFGSVGDGRGGREGEQSPVLRFGVKKGGFGVCLGWEKTGRESKAQCCVLG